MSPALFVEIASVEARKRLSYRGDFWISAILAFAVQFGVAYFLWTSVFRDSGQATIGGYTENGMILYYASALLLGKITRGLELEGAISQDIYDGQLSRYLLYPAGFFRFKYAQQIGAMLPVALQLMLLGVWFPILLDLPADTRLSAGSFLMAVVAVLAGNLLNFMMTIPIQAVAFWADNVWSLMVAYRIFSGLLGGSMLPLGIFPDSARVVLQWLPFRFLFAFPVDTMLGRVSAVEWAAGIALALLWCAVFAALARLVWRRGDFQYTGIGM